MGFFSKLFGKSDVQGCTKSQAHPPLNSAQLLRDIAKHVSLVLGEEITQAERIAALIKFGPDVIREIEATIQYVAVHGESDSEFENAGLLCEAIGKIGGKEAIDVLKRFATTESNIWEYRHIRSGAEKGLSYLDNSQLDAKTEGEKSKREGEQGKAMTRESILGLLDIAYEQAKRGECIPAVHTFLQAVEIEPRFMMSSGVWLNIASVVTGAVPPGRTKNWIKLPKELVPDRVVAQLSRLPNDSLFPGYPSPFIEPPTETEIRELIADLREILRRYADPATISVSTHDGASDIPTGKEHHRSEQADSGVMSDQEMLSILTKLCTAYANDDPVSKELEPVATEIGEQLDKRGGISEMRRVFNLIPNMRGKRTLEMHWGGIGEWQG